MDHENILFANLRPPESFLKKFSSLVKNYTTATDHDTDYHISQLTDKDHSHLAKTGVYYNVEKQAFMCAFCPFITSHISHKKFTLHLFSLCPNSLKLLQGSVDLRLQSFNSSIKHSHSTHIVRELVTNGFYLNHNDNKIYCCLCKIVLLKLNKKDSIRLLHQVYSPKCKFCKDQDHVVELSNVWRDRKDVAAKPTRQPSNYLPSAPELEKIHDDSDDHNQKRLYPSLVDSVKSTYNEDIKVQFDAQNRLNDVVVDNDDALCKICFERRKNICFMPCRHVSTCFMCAQKCRRCCICRAPVQQKIKVFL